MQLVVGYGNPLRGDDGIGYWVAVQLETLFQQERLEAVACHQLTPELVEHLRYADRVIFVDAAEGLRVPGISVQYLIPDESGGSFTHNVTPQSLLAAVKAWYGMQPEAYLVSVAGRDFGFSESLSPPLQTLIPDIIRQIQTLIELPSISTHAGFTVHE